MNKNPLLTQAWRALARPCETPYVPLYPLAGPAEGTAFLDWQTATAEQFKGTPEHFSYDADWPVWSFVTHANAVDYLRDEFKDNAKKIRELEAKQAAERPAVEARAAAALCRVAGKGTRLSA